MVQRKRPQHPNKEHREIKREYNTAVYLLRCLQLGLHDEDLESMNYGMILDLFIEADNDTLEYPEIATQADFDKF